VKKIIPIITAISLVLVLAACGKAFPASDDVETETPPVVSEEPVIYTNPLTGEIVEKEPENTRPFAVMINNISVALPHCGTSQADIVYEILAESDITRMLAIFSDVSDVEKIGSMRSARPYYIDVALSYDAIYVHAGGSDQAYSDISTKNVSSLDGVRTTFNSNVFYRDPNRMSQGYEHSMFTSGEGILAGVDEKGYELMHDGSKYDYGLVFAKDGENVAMTDSVPAADVDVSFGGLKNTRLSYDSSTGLYTPEEYGNTIIDGNSNEPLQFKNVLIVNADTKIVDDYGRRSVNLIGEGTGKFICDGKCIDITWKRGGSNEPFRYYADGKELTLAVGKSYIAVVPTESEIGLA
jgi:hypothetical protein